MGKVYAVINQKGGVGKTTTVFNMGAEIAKRGYKVLLMDMDPQANLTSYMGYDEDELDVESTIVGLLRSMVEGNPVQDIKQYILKRGNVDLIPSSIMLSSLEIPMVGTVAREYLTKKMLTALRDNYDYIIIDSPPTLGLFVINILTAADEVIIPIKASKMSINGFKSLLDSIGMIKKNTNTNLYITGVLVTMFNPRLNAAKATLECLEQLCSKYNISIFKSKIGNSTQADMAFDEKKTIEELDCNSVLAKQYAGFVNEVIEYGKK